MRAPLGVRRIAAGLIAISVPAADRELLVGDLEEQFVRRERRDGLRSATRWYWAQAIRIVLVLGPRRVLAIHRHLVIPGALGVATRSLVRSPGTSIASCAILAVGIAAPVAMFALADGVTHSLPGDPTDRVVRLSQVGQAGRVELGVGWPAFEAWRRHAVGDGLALASIAAYRSEGPVAVRDGAEPAGRYLGAYATPGLFPLLGVSPRLGRLFVPETSAGLPAALIREDLWIERFERDPDAIGKVLQIDGQDHVVVGVLPRAFGFPVDHMVWMQPRGSEEADWSVVGRLGPSGENEVAEEQLWAVLAARPADSLKRSGGAARAIHVEKFTRAHFTYDRGDELSRDAGGVSLILLILTALNVAAVMMARGVARGRETTIRLALGASRRQVVALTVAESLLICMTGGVLGLLLGRLALATIVRHLTNQATVLPYWMDFSLGVSSLVLTGFLVLSALVVSGVLPGIYGSRINVDGALRANLGGGRIRMRRAMTLLVGLEATLSCLLLVIAGTVVAEALSDLADGVSFPVDDILTGQVSLEAPDYPHGGARSAFLSALLESVRAEPSVLAATWTSELPGKAASVRPVGLAGLDDEAFDLPPASVRSIDTDFFSLFPLKVVSGRLLRSDDKLGDPVAVVNEEFARRHGIHGDVSGQTLKLPRLNGSGVDAAAIVGIVADQGITPHWRGQPVPGVYLPLRQEPTTHGYLLVRTQADTPFQDVWRDAVSSIDPYLPLGGVLSLDQALQRGRGSATLFMTVFVLMGGSTLLVVLVGLYGLHSFTLANQVHEFGLKRALGAQARAIAWDSVRRGSRPILAGVILGTVPGVWGAQLLVPAQGHLRESLLGPALLVAASLIALCSLTWSALGTSPMEGLRDP